MDATTPPYDEKRFGEVKEEVTKFLKMVQYDISKVNFIPTSAYKGDNVVNKGNLGWYKGPSLLEGINELNTPEKPTNLPLRLPIQDVYNITGIGAVPVGRIETGILKVGAKVSFQPANAVGEIKSIEMHHEMMDSAEPGDNVGFNVRGVGKKDVRRGDVCGPEDAPPTVAKGFVAQVAVLQHPSVIAKGYTPVFHAHTSQIACTFDELQTKIDPKTGQAKEQNPDFLKSGDIAIVHITQTRPMVIENVKDIPQLGRFAIRDMGTTVAAGMCVKVEKKE
jgi:elongation factor 1-alpha